MSTINSENTFELDIITLFKKLHPLDRIPRAGYLLRGITECESVSAHSHFVSLLTLLFTEEYPDQFQKDRALSMALIHDLPESVLMDIPMPVTDKFLKEKKEAAENGIINQLFLKFPGIYNDLFAEFIAKKTPEARLVAGLDKAQLMLKVLCYQKENRGNLEEFWYNPANFNDYGIEVVSRLFDEICKSAGFLRPLE